MQETGSFLEISVGILFSLWTLQQLLVPDYIVGTTIVHNSILVLYLIFSFAILIRFIVKPIWDKTSPDKTIVPHGTENSQQGSVLISSDNLPDKSQTTGTQPNSTFVKPLFAFFAILLGLIGLFRLRRKGSVFH